MIAPNTPSFKTPLCAIAMALPASASKPLFYQSCFAQLSGLHDPMDKDEFYDACFEIADSYGLFLGRVTINSVFYYFTANKNDFQTPT